MSLLGAIRKAVDDGHLEQQWTTADLLATASLIDRFSRSGLRSTPSNRSASLPGLALGTGHDVVDTATAPYLRVGIRGGAILYCLRDHAGEQGPDGPAFPDGEQRVAVCGDQVLDEVVESDVTVREAPTTPHRLGDQAGQALALLVERMHQELPWDGRLLNYTWKNRSFVGTQRNLAEFIAQGSALTRCIEQGVAWSGEEEILAVTWAKGIFAWGGTRQKMPVTWQKVRNTLTNAAFNRSESPDAPMNSGYTKVASFGTAFFEDGSSGTPQAINDSRVATSLTCRLDPILREHGWLPADTFPGLGRIEAARGGTRPRPLSRTWPDAYQRWSGQFAATSVVLAIRDILNSDGRYPRMPYAGKEVAWSVRGVEAVLFMDGY